MTKLPKPKSETRAPIDWEAIEREYRLGQHSVREIAKRHGVGHQSILRHAAKGRWTQDKAPEVSRRVAERLLLTAPDHAERTTGPDQSGQGYGPHGPRAEITEDDIEAAVEEKVSIHVAHRKMGRDFRSILVGLAEELRVTTAQLEEIRDDIIADTEGDADRSRRARMLRAISLPSRVTSAASIISSGKNIQWIERLANNLAPALPQDAGAADTGPWRIVQFGDIVEASESDAAQP